MTPDDILDFRPLRRRPIIYVWKRGIEYLYIGQSKMGIGRVTHHHIIDVLEPVQLGDKIEIYNCEESKLDEMEALWIKKYNPRFNTTGKDTVDLGHCRYCRKDFISIDGSKFCNDDCFNLYKQRAQNVNKTFDKNGDQVCPSCSKVLGLKIRSNKIFCNSKCKFAYWNKLHPRT